MADFTGDKPYEERIGSLESIIQERRKIYSSIPAPKDLMDTIATAIEESANVADDKVESITKAVRSEMKDFIDVQTFRSKELKNLEAFQKNFGDMLEEEADSFKHKSTVVLLKEFKKVLKQLEKFSKLKKESLIE